MEWIFHMTNKSENADVMLLKEEDYDVKESLLIKVFSFLSKYAFIFINILNLMFFCFIILLSSLIFIFIVIHVSEILNFDPYNLFSNIFLNDKLSVYFEHIEQKFHGDVLEPLISYVLLIFILADIIKYIISDQITYIYLSIDDLVRDKNEESKIHQTHPSFRNLFMIIFSAILFELFLKLFSSNENEIISMAYLLTGTLFSGSIFIYIISQKSLKI